jgi:hypothetical protein
MAVRMSNGMVAACGAARRHFSTSRAVARGRDFRGLGRKFRRIAL